MNSDSPQAEVEIRGGARLTLFANRLVIAGGDSTEIVPLAHLASVRVAFERDARKLNWAIALLVAALVLAALSGPLASWMTALTGKLTAAPEREGLESVLIAAFSAIGALARLMMPVAVLLAGGALALAAFFWIGHTKLTLSFAAAERACAARGRDPQLADFAHQLGERLAERRG